MDNIQEKDDNRSKLEIIKGNLSPGLIVAILGYVLYLVNSLLIKEDNLYYLMYAMFAFSIYLNREGMYEYIRLRKEKEAEKRARPKKRFWFFGAKKEEIKELDIKND